MKSSKKDRPKLSVHTLATLRKIVPVYQWAGIRAALASEERDFFAEALVTIERQYNAMPAAGETEHQPESQKLAPIHLFSPGGDWWLIEKPDDDGTVFGIADLGHREYGGIWLPDVLNHPFCEIDLHYTPRSAADIMAG